MDELTDVQLEELRQSLLSLREELQLALSKSSEDSKPIDLDLPIGRVSRIDAIQQQKMAQDNKRSQEVRLRQIQSALKRIEAEDYGECKQCEDPIGFARLKARPESLLCLECQTKLEQR